jgi:hypothetical protein
VFCVLIAKTLTPKFVCRPYSYRAISRGGTYPG